MRFKQLLFLSIIYLSACQPTELNTIASIETSKVEIETTRTSFLTQISSQTLVILPTNSAIPTAPETLNPSQTPVVIVPSYNGTVKEQSNCRYGAGSAYLFEWGLYPGDSVLIINRNWDGTWVYVKPTTYNNECWVKAENLDFKGNTNNLAEFYAPLPYVYTYLYTPVKYVTVKRNGYEVMISWDPVWMTEDDDRGYLIEAWVCQNGSFIFLPINYFPYTKTYAKIIDEQGCAQTSHARFYTVEKHGYMPFIEIPWPPYE